MVKTFSTTTVLLVGWYFFCARAKKKGKEGVLRDFVEKY
jgi:hypothetical protein